MHEVVGYNMKNFLSICRPKDGLRVIFTIWVGSCYLT